MQPARQDATTRPTHCAAAASSLQVVAVANTELPPSHILRRSATLYNYSLHLMLINSSDAVETASPHSQKPAKLVKSPIHTTHQCIQILQPRSPIHLT